MNYAYSQRVFRSEGKGRVEVIAKQAEEASGKVGQRGARRRRGGSSRRRSPGTRARRDWFLSPGQELPAAGPGGCESRRPVLVHLVQQMHAMQRRGVPRQQICRALGLNASLAQAFGLGRAEPTPDPFGSDPRRRRAGRAAGRRSR